MELVEYARRTRLFFETLFTGRLVVELRATLDEARAQRDYFKGRAERLELILQQRFSRRDPERPNHAVNEASPRPSLRAGHSGPKTWKQIQREYLEKMRMDQQAQTVERESKKSEAAKISN